MIIEHCEQYSAEWWKLRTGAVTMSHAKELLTGGKGITRRRYLLDVVGERLSGVPTERPSTYAMQRGLELETYALAAYERIMRVQVRRIGFVWRDATRRVGGSPDGLVGDIGVEIKCPFPRAHVRWMDDPDGNGHAEQMQGLMWLLGVSEFHFVSYCPEFERVPLFVHEVERDDETVDRIASASTWAVDQIDLIEANIRSSADPDDAAAIADINAEALRHLEALFGDGEVDVDE